MVILLLQKKKNILIKLPVKTTSNKFSKLHVCMYACSSVLEFEYKLQFAIWSLARKTWQRRCDQRIFRLLMAYSICNPEDFWILLKLFDWYEMTVPLLKKKRNSLLDLKKESKLETRTHSHILNVTLNSMARCNFLTCSVGIPDRWTLQDYQSKRS